MEIKIENLSYTEAQSLLKDKLCESLSSGVNIIQTNGHIAMIIQDLIQDDSGPPKLESDENGKAVLVKVCDFENIPVYLDPYMKWDDGRILLKKDDDILEEIELSDPDYILL